MKLDCCVFYGSSSFLKTLEITSPLKSGPQSARPLIFNIENKVGVDFEGIGFEEIGFEEVDLIDQEVDIVENKVGVDFEGIGFEEKGFEEVNIKFERFEFEEINIEGEGVINKDEFRLTGDIQEDREVD
jgi:hypothetical protein